MTELGQQTLKLANVHQVVDVAFRDATFRYSNIRTKLGDSEVSDINSNKLHIKADIMNIGNAAGQVTIPLTIDGQVV